MRLFVALTPPDEVLEQLRVATAALRANHPELRWTRPEQWHLTLAFLGQVADQTRDRLAERLDRAAARCPPLALSFAGAGRFGRRVLWTRVQGDRDALARLADSVRAAARRCDLPVEDRPYRPHLTLARARDAADLRPLVDELAEFQTRTWTATEMHLVRSRLGAGPGGTAVHEAVSSWPLRGA